MRSAGRQAQVIPQPDCIALIFKLASIVLNDDDDDGDQIADGLKQCARITRTHLNFQETSSEQVHLGDGSLAGSVVMRALDVCAAGPIKRGMQI